jgi:hypothetical protein
MGRKPSFFIRRLGHLLSRIAEPRLVRHLPLRSGERTTADMAALIPLVTPSRHESICELHSIVSLDAGVIHQGI